MAQAASKIAQFLPPEHSWHLEPTIALMLNVLEQHLLDGCDPALRSARGSIVQTIHAVTWPLSLICNVIGRTHPDRERLEHVHDQLSDLGERLHGMDRIAIVRRLEDISGMIRVDANVSPLDGR